MKTILLFLAMLTIHATAMDIVLSVDVIFAGEDGESDLILKQGTTLHVERTEGYYYVVNYDGDELMINGDLGGEMHHRLSDRAADARFIEICAELRAQKILATNANVMRILAKEQQNEDAAQAIEDLANELKKLNQTLDHERYRRSR